jgi:hypothetical protein
LLAIVGIISLITFLININIPITSENITDTNTVNNKYLYITISAVITFLCAAAIGLIIGYRKHI